jgi:hypothetical protein
MPHDHNDVHLIPNNSPLITHDAPLISHDAPLISHDAPLISNNGFDEVRLSEVSPRSSSIYRDKHEKLPVAFHSSSGIPLDEVSRVSSSAIENHVEDRDDLKYVSKVEVPMPNNIPKELNINLKYGRRFSSGQILSNKKGDLFVFIASVSPSYIAKATKKLLLIQRNGSFLLENLRTNSMRSLHLKPCLQTELSDLKSCLNSKYIEEYLQNVALDSMRVRAAKESTPKKNYPPRKMKKSNKKKEESEYESSTESETESNYSSDSSSETDVQIFRKRKLLPQKNERDSKKQCIETSNEIYLQEENLISNMNNAGPDIYKGSSNPDTCNEPAPSVLNRSPHPSPQVPLSNIVSFTAPSPSPEIQVFPSSIPPSSISQQTHAAVYPQSYSSVPAPILQPPVQCCTFPLQNPILQHPFFSFNGLPYSQPLYSNYQTCYDPNFASNGFESLNRFPYSNQYGVVQNPVSPFTTFQHAQFQNNHQIG